MARQLAGLTDLPAIDGFRPLLYPFFLSLFYRISPEHARLIAVCFQHLLGVIMVIILIRLAGRLFRDDRAGLAAGLLYALAGPPLFYEGLLLATTLFSFFLLLTTTAVFYALEAPSDRQSLLRWTAAGALLGLSAQIRANALILLPAFPLLGFFTPPRENLRRYDPFPFFAVTAALAVQLAGAVWIASYTQHFSFLPSAGGINFYLGNHPGSDGMYPRQFRSVSFREVAVRDPFCILAEEEFRKETTNRFFSLTPTAISTFWRQKTFNAIREQPSSWLKLMLQKGTLLFWNHEISNNRSYSFAAQTDLPLLRFLPVRWCLLLALFPLGLTALYHAGRLAFLSWETAFFVLFSTGIVLFFVTGRFRIPLWPQLALVGGGELLLTVRIIGRRLCKNKKEERKSLPKSAIITSLSLLLLSCFNWLHVPPDPMENDLAIRANACCEQGRYDEAEQDIRRCLAIDPHNSRYHFILGNVLLGKEQPKAAVQAYLQAIKLKPDAAPFYNNLGIALEKTGNREAARKAYLRALQIDPLLEEARRNLHALETEGIPFTPK